eukprot:s4642_g1.t1
MVFIVPLSLTVSEVTITSQMTGLELKEVISDECRVRPEDQNLLTSKGYIENAKALEENDVMDEPYIFVIPANSIEDDDEKNKMMYDDMFYLSNLCHDEVDGEIGRRELNNGQTVSSAFICGYKCMRGRQGEQSFLSFLEQIGVLRGGGDGGNPLLTQDDTDDEENETLTFNVTVSRATGGESKSTMTFNANDTVATILTKLPRGNKKFEVCISDDVAQPEDEPDDDVSTSVPPSTPKEPSSSATLASDDITLSVKNMCAQPYTQIDIAFKPTLSLAGMRDKIMQKLNIRQSFVKSVKVFATRSQVELLTNTRKKIGTLMAQGVIKTGDVVEVTTSLVGGAKGVANAKTKQVQKQKHLTKSDEQKHLMNEVARTTSPTLMAVPELAELANKVKAFMDEANSKDGMTAITNQLKHLLATSPPSFQEMLQTLKESNSNNSSIKIGLVAHIFLRTENAKVTKEHVCNMADLPKNALISAFESAVATHDFSMSKLIGLMETMNTIGMMTSAPSSYAGGASVPALPPAPTSDAHMSG